MVVWAYLALAVAAGIGLPVQAGVNAELARYVGGPIRAAAVSFGVGTIALAILALALYRLWPGPRLAGAPWWIWAGGLFGALYVASTAAAAPRVGAAALVAAAVAGQTLAGLVLDRLGAVGYPVHAITPGRAAGALLVVAGVVLVRLF